MVQRVKKTKALFIGRFQPFHTGHFLTILDIGAKHSEVIIGIGSADDGFTEENPFTAKEREQMIKLSLEEQKFAWSIYHIPDIDNDEEWVSHVKGIVGHFDVAYSGNDRCIELFQKAGTQTLTQKMIQRHRFWGTEIRKRILQRKKWEGLVPEPVAQYLQQIHAGERIRTITSDRPVETFNTQVDNIYSEISLLEQAFRHKSFIHEKGGDSLESNERLEFIGDAVLQLVVTEKLYAKYTESSEGDMTSLRSSIVRTESLAKAAEILKLGSYMRMSFGEEKNGGRHNSTILAGCFEAILGALYLDRGYEAAKIFVTKHLLTHLPKHFSAETTKDYKTRLQEYLQERFKSHPTYVLLNQEGPDHSKLFTFAVVFGDKNIGTGSGANKQIAQQEAARDALIKLDPA